MNEIYIKIEQVIKEKGYILKKDLADILYQEFPDELSIDTANDEIQDWADLRADDPLINNLKKQSKGFGFVKDKATNFKKKHNLNIKIGGNDVIYYVDDYFGQNIVLDIRQLISKNKFDLAIHLLKRNRRYTVLELKELFNLLKVEDLKTKSKNNPVNTFNLLNLFNVVLKIIESELDYYKGDEFKLLKNYKENMVQIILEFYKSYTHNFDSIIINENPFLKKYSDIIEECSNYLIKYGPIKYNPFEKSKNNTKESKKLFSLETKKSELHRKFDEFETKKYLFIDIRKKLISILNLFEDKDNLISNFKKEIYDLSVYEESLISSESNLKKYCEKKGIKYPILNYKIHKEDVDLIDLVNKYNNCDTQYRNYYNLIVKCYKENILDFLFNSKEFVVTKEQLIFKFPDNKGTLSLLLML